MKYYMNTDGNYIVSVATINGNGDGNITESEYIQILSTLQNIPQETDTIGHHLTTSLEWEQYEKEPEPEDDDIDDSEALNIILGETP